MLNVITALCLVGASSAPGSPGVRKAAPEVHSAVLRALMPLSATVKEYPNKVRCFSCHHQGVPSLGLALAKRAGYTVQQPIDQALKHTLSDLAADVELYKTGDGQPGGVSRAGYALLALSSAGSPASATTDAITAWMLKRDAAMPFWKARSNRPPAEFSNFTDSALAANALLHYGQTGSREAISTRLAKARKWLSENQPKETEDRVFRLWGLKLCGADESVISSAAQDLLGQQQADGGWAQLPSAPTSTDAYATASAMTILRLTGSVKPDDPRYAKGVNYLLRTQLADGTWHVTTRSHPVQPYFESGFPHAKDQFISVTATAWAIAALTLTQVDGLQ